MGDLQSSHFEKEEFNLAMGAVGKYRINEFLNARASFTKATISGEDRGRNIHRNLHFRSEIKEFNLLAEFHFLSFINGDRPMISPYVFGGVAAFHFNPQAVYKNQWYDLQPLATEGQNRYGLVQVSVPVGFGTQVYLTDAISIGLEGGLRKTFTDYLDDVSSNYTDIDGLTETDPIAAALAFRTPEYMGEESLPNPMGQTRGNPNNKDWYFFTGMTFMVNIAGLMELAGGPGIYNPF